MLIKSSRLISLIKPLSAKEKKELILFSSSPIFNLNQQITQLLQILLFEKHKVITDEQLYHKIFPDSTFNAQKLRHLFSYSIQNVCKFLEFSELQKVPGINNLMLLRSYRRFKRHDDFIKQYEIECNLINQQATNTNAFINAYYMHIEHYEESVSKQRTASVNLENLTLSLDAFYICSKLKLACNALTHKNLFHSNKSYTLDPLTLQMLESEAFLRVPLIHMLFAAYLTLADPDNEQHFKNLKESLITKSEKISHDELKDMYTIAINYCIKKLNTGHMSYLNEALDIYKLGLAKDIFLDNETLSPFTYKNITSAALRLGEMEWTLEFIQQYKERLPSAQRDEFYAFCLGKYYTATKASDKVTDCLHNKEFTDLFTNLDAKVMLIKAYYELQSYSLVDSLLDNFRHWMQRKEVLGYHKSNYSNFIKAVKYLLKSQHANNQIRSEIETKIKQFNILTERDWLLNKLSENA